MSDIVFITPNMRNDFSGESLGTLQLTTILEQQGLHCQILSFARIGRPSNFEPFIESALEKVAQEQPKIVSFYTRCDSYHISLRLAERIKARWNDIYIVFGGPQSDTTAEDTIACIPYVDFVCCGEGETTIYPLFSSLLRREPDLSIPGLVYRNGDTVVKNPRPALLEDLDSLPMLDFSTLQATGECDDISHILFPIDVGRGCPFGCTYCSTKSFWGRKYRTKSPQRIYEEIKEIHQRFGNTGFKFNHDMFTFNRKTITETCRLLKTLDFPIRWTCSARLDCLDPELIDTMVDAGMFRVFVGIESGSRRMQKLINKNLKLDKAVETLNYLKSKKIAVTTSFIYGFPEETEEDLCQTMALMADILHNHCGHVSAHLCTFLSRTELSERYMSQMTRTNTYTDFTGNIAIDECEDLIQGYPQLFPHFMEYRTPLRDKLKYFGIFFRVWSFLEPVYHHLAEQYGSDRLIDMYYDFVEANREALEQTDKLRLNNAAAYVVERDQMHLRLANDEVYDIVKDCYRMALTECSETVESGGSTTAIYCFDPRERQKVASIRDYKRCVAVVNYANHKTVVQTYPAKSM